MKNKNKNIIWHQFKVTREIRESLLSQKAKCIFFTGLSGSGKSTISDELEILFDTLGINSYSLDGDNIRSGINNNLGFSPEELKLARQFAITRR